MKNYWTTTFRRLAAGAIVAGATAFSSASCYAALAFDSASDPVYADGWQGITHAGTLMPLPGGGAQLTAGDNGGFGFTPWNFDSAYVASGNYGKPFGYNYGNYAPGLLAIDSANPFNNIGTAWDIGAIQATPPAKDGAVRAGRGFSLGIGQTLKLKIDNPTVAQFYKGFFVRLSGGTGGVNGNICNSAAQGCTIGGTPLEKANFAFFKYANPFDHWHFVDTADTDTGVTIGNTGAAGAELSVKRTGANAYDVRIHPLNGSPDFFEANRTFKNPGAELDWLEITFFNTYHDATMPTDFYMSRMQIVPEPGTAVLFVLGTGVLLGAAGARRRREDE